MLGWAGVARRFVSRFEFYGVFLLGWDLINGVAGKEIASNKTSGCAVGVSWVDR